MADSVKTPLEIAMEVDPKLVKFFDAIEEALGGLHPKYYPYSWRSMPEGYDPESCAYVMRGVAAALDKYAAPEGD